MFTEIALCRSKAKAVVLAEKAVISDDSNQIEPQLWKVLYAIFPLCLRYIEASRSVRIVRASSCRYCREQR